MAHTVTVDVRVANLLQVSQVLGVATVLLRELAKCSDLPEPVMVAADHLRRDLEALSPDDPPDPYRDPAVEDRIRDAMAEEPPPGRIVTR